MLTAVQAVQQCGAIGGRLPVIQSLGDNQFLDYLFQVLYLIITIYCITFYIAYFAYKIPAILLLLNTKSIRV